MLIMLFLIGGVVGSVMTIIWQTRARFIAMLQNMLKGKAKPDG